jgi:hypothetical protein
MKYRRLTEEELISMETEFVRFLVANTVTASDWERIKAESPEKAEGLIAIFSDLVFDKILGKVEYIEYRTPQDLKTFHFGKDKIQLRGLSAEGIRGIDFTVGQPLSDMKTYLNSSDGEGLRIYRAEKGYKYEDPKQEIFELLEAGAVITDGDVFEALVALKP